MKATDRNRPGLPDRDLQAGHVGLPRAPPLDFRGIGRLEEEFQGFLEILPRLLDGVSLTGDIEFRTKGDISVPFSLDDGGEVLDSVQFFTSGSRPCDPDLLMSSRNYSPEKGTKHP